MSRWNSALALGAALTAVLACRPTPRSDAMIATEIREDLRDESELQGEAITVQSVNGEVTLQGVVPTEDARKQAEEIADDVEGVTRVANQLRVTGAPASPAPPVASPPPSPGGSMEPTTPETAPPTAP